VVNLHVHAMGARTRTVGSSKVWSTPPIIQEFMHFIDACSAIGRGKTASRPDTHHWIRWSGQVPVKRTGHRCVRSGKISTPSNACETWFPLTIDMTSQIARGRLECPVPQSSLEGCDLKVWVGGGWNGSVRSVHRPKRRKKKPLSGTRGRGGVGTWQGGKRKQPERSRFWKLSELSPMAGKGLGETDIGEGTLFVGVRATTSDE